MPSGMPAGRPVHQCGPQGPRHWENPHEERTFKAQLIRLGRACLIIWPGLAWGAPDAAAWNPGHVQGDFFTQPILELLPTDWNHDAPAKEPGTIFFPNPRIHLIAPRLYWNWDYWTS